jgi:hypothetical protein
MAVYFLGAEAATASLLLQRVTGHFDVRTCKAAMPQMRVSAALVVKAWQASPKGPDSTVFRCRRLVPAKHAG